MDYEKKYKEALEKARAYDEAIDKVAHFIKKHIGFGCIIHPNSSEAKELFNIFPELKESEDERTRKAIIDIVKSQKEQQCHIDGAIFDKMIDWLEKQGDVDKRIQEEIEKRTMQQRVCERQDYPYQPGWRKNSADNKPAKKHSVLMLTTHGVAEGEWLGEDWCQYRWSCNVKDSEVLFWIHLSDLERLEKEGEQKHAEWGEEDENNILFLTSIIEECFKDKEKITLYGDTEAANFSKEDVIDRLKSLKDRVKPQPQTKTELSEEDERNIKDSIFYLKSAKKYFEKDDNILWNEKWFNSCIEWLESLKPQSHWKPSKQQMIELYAASHKAYFNTEVLRDLYNDLTEL